MRSHKRIRFLAFVVFTLCCAALIVLILVSAQTGYRDGMYDETVRAIYATNTFVAKALAGTQTAQAQLTLAFTAK